MTDSSIQTTQGVLTTREIYPEGAVARLVLGHGAGADLGHSHMEAIASALAKVGIATLRFNFPFMERGRPRTDSKAVCLETIEAALAAVPDDLPCYLGGHSFGGRMASHYVAEAGAGAWERRRPRGLIYFSFPLHPAGKPSSTRAEHMDAITLPQLFLSGTRDKLAEPGLLTAVVDRLPNATLAWLDTGDHGFRILKRSRQSTEDIYDEAARHAIDFVRRNGAQPPAS